MAFVLLRFTLKDRFLRERETGEPSMEFFPLSSSPNVSPDAKWQKGVLKRFCVIAVCCFCIGQTHTHTHTHTPFPASQGR